MTFVAFCTRREKRLGSIEMLSRPILALPPFPNHTLSLFVGVWPYVRRKKHVPNECRVEEKKKFSWNWNKRVNAFGKGYEKSEESRATGWAVSLTGTRWLQKRHWQLSFARTFARF